MPDQAGVPVPSYELVLPGELGPVLLATCTAMGAGSSRTSSDFLLSVPQDRSLPDVVAMFQEKGFVVLAIRRVEPPAGGNTDVARD